MKVITKKEFHGFIQKLINNSAFNVEGVKAKGEKFVFDTLETADELRLDYDVTILPPKKYFLPQYETLMEFTTSEPFENKKPTQSKKTIIVGVHPYDIIAIQQADAYYLDDEISEEYLQKRKNALILGSDVLTVGEKSFFGAMGTGEVTDGYDLYLTDLGDRVVIDIGTKAGEQLLSHAEHVKEASKKDMQRVQKIRQAAIQGAQRDLKLPPNKWYDLLEKNRESSVWKEESDQCLACGTCTMVCPTCFCYDVRDEVDIDMQHGKRLRTWDGCLLREFTAVGSGEIFREDILDRYRHRYYRKAQYLPNRLGFVACVGCGRCSSQCIPDIADPVKLINMITDASSYEPLETTATPQSLSLHIDDIKQGEALHEPLPATLQEVMKLTEKETYFKIALDNNEPFLFEPGQFVEVSIAGIGEAPISLSSAPNGVSFELVVRKVGDVTSALHRMKAGDKVGIRGPFGNGFDVDAMKGKDLLFIGAGLGIVPLRSLINYVIDPRHRKDYGKVTILYGCKEPCEMLFGDEVAEWDRRDDIDHMRTVDTCPEGVCWEGDIGLITALIPKATVDPSNTIAVLVGPPIVYKFCNDILLKLGIAEEDIIVSLERRMKCGVGKCGHCQINGKYVCKDGPVFRYADVKDLPEAFT